VLKTPRNAFTYQIEVRFRDLDPLGHVNNSVYLTYLESARIAYWMDVTSSRDVKRLDMILARVEVDFRSPAYYGDRLDVATWCVSIGQTSFVLESRITEHRTNRLVAEAKKVLVYFDHAAGKPRPLPPEVRERLRPTEVGGHRPG
jgi:acyl-CoA thioester hydrolase